MQDTVFLYVLSEFMLAGDMALIGDVVEVTAAEARDLLARNLARPATEDDQPTIEPPADKPTGKAKK
jgi:hypothetical protein